ncbi:ATP-binding protein [Nonomuraea rubra]|uniref:Uncharacterized protein n=1 Tax=Nonomuraea rubra TaxID=46180 RepID=A0A7X0U1Q7_9ACTN|nr:ATP-binding protein [Nonomuraea rubra]MBB6551640.1 hypothetical protein [Nonomuraea rubra]
MRRIHQRATGSGFARIYQAAGDMIIYDGGEPYRLALWPAPAAAPPPEQARARPSGLLQAANGLVAFTGRRDLLDDLRRWRDGPGLEVRLIHGAGGQGKTRLAHEVARAWRQDGWVALAARHRRDRSVPEPFVVPDLARAAGVLVVVDYAERWDTADVLSLLADTRVGTGLPVRVLLLARPAGGTRGSRCSKRPSRSGVSWPPPTPPPTCRPRPGPPHHDHGAAPPCLRG